MTTNARCLEFIPSRIFTFMIEHLKCQCTFKIPNIYSCLLDGVNLSSCTCFAIL